MVNDFSNAIEAMNDAGARAIGLLAHLIESQGVPAYHMARAVEIVKQFNDAVESTRPHAIASQLTGERGENGD